MVCTIFAKWQSVCLNTNLKKVTNYLKFKRGQSQVFFCFFTPLTELLVLFFQCHSAAAGSSAHCHACVKTRMMTSDALDGLSCMVPFSFCYMCNSQLHYCLYS